jgi:hypothetical protein
MAPLFFDEWSNVKTKTAAGGLILENDSLAKPKQPFNRSKLFLPRRPGITINAGNAGCR